MIEKALSIRAPWWWFILYGGKDIENRGPSFPRSRREVVWVHVGKWWRPAEVWEDLVDARAMQEAAGYKGPPVPEDWRGLERFCGCIVGSIQIVDYVTSSDSPWFVGDVGLVLRNPVPLHQPVPFKGMLGFFDVPAGLIGEAA